MDERKIIIETIDYLKAEFQKNGFLEIHLTHRGWLTPNEFIGSDGCSCIETEWEETFNYDPEIGYFFMENCVQPLEAKKPFLRLKEAF